MVLIVFNTWNIVVGSQAMVFRIMLRSKAESTIKLASSLEHGKLGICVYI